MTLGFLNVQSWTGSLFSYFVLLCDPFHCLCKYLRIFEFQTLLRLNIFPAVCWCDFCVYHYIILFMFLVGFRRYEVHAGTGWNFFCFVSLTASQIFWAPLVLLFDVSFFRLWEFEVRACKVVLWIFGPDVAWNSWLIYCRSGSLKIRFGFS